MKFKYYSEDITLKYNPKKCRGCMMCVEVCPHAVFEMRGKKAVLADKNSCMECGACRMNCPYGAIFVDSGVGCAAAIMSSLNNKKNAKACCG